MLVRRPREEVVPTTLSPSMDLFGVSVAVTASSLLGVIGMLREETREETGVVITAEEGEGEASTSTPSPLVSRPSLRPRLPIVVVDFDSAEDRD